MNRILIIEDNKTLANALVKKLSAKLGCEVDVAYKLGEAKLFLKMYTYFIVVTDINLPDAPNGEVVDYLIEKKAHTIVLTSNTDKEFRKTMLEKKIIDYIIKDGTNDLPSIISTIRRLHKNQTHKVLVVDDSMVFRRQMQSMLQNLFINVYTVAHGEEALGMIQTHPDISLVLTDYNMPVMDGMELTIELRKTRDKSNLSIIAISSNEESDINSQFLKNGANDYIKKPFSNEEFSCRVNNALEAIENINTIKNSERDFLTGLYNRRYFFEHMKEYAEDTKESGEKFAVGMIDIDSCKKINDIHRHDIRNKVIVSLSEILRANTNHRDIVARFNGAEFCVVLKNVNKRSAINIFERLRKKVENFSFTTDKDQLIKFTISIGISTEHGDTLDETLSQADMMLYNAKQNGENQIVFE